MKTRFPWIAAPLVALAIAGCGGGDDETTTAEPVATTTTTVLTKAELIAQGDAICAEVNAAVGTVSAGAVEGASQVSQEADLYGGMVDRLKGLGTPDDTAGYPEFIEAADELAQAESDAALAAERGDEAGSLEAQEDVSSALSSFQAAAQTYGFEECGEAPSAPTPAASGEEATEESLEEPVEEEAEPAPEEEAEVAPETGGAAGAPESTGGGTVEGGEGGGVSGGGSGGIEPR